MTEHRYPTAKCDTCRADIIWAVSAKTGARMPIDVKPVETGGNIQLQPGPEPDSPPFAITLTVAQQFGKKNLRLSHFATCPNAAAHRRGKGRPRP